MIKRISNRLLSLMIAFSMILSVFPVIMIRTNADDLNISGTLSDVPGDTMGELVSASASKSEENGTGSVTISKNVITIAAKGVSATSGCSSTPAKASTTTWTMKNNHGTVATVTYTFVKTAGDGSVSPAGGTVTIQAGGTVDFQVTSAAPDTAAETKATLTLTGVTFAVKACTTAFLQTTNGTYSGSCSDGWQVVPGQSHEALSDQYYQLTAVPDPGYGFSAWIDGNGTVISRANPYTMSPADRSVTAKFIPAGSAIYYIKGNASTEYYYLDQAIAAAGSSGTVVVKEDGKVLGSSGQTSFSVPSGVTLLVPYDAAATVIKNDMKSHVNEAYSNPPPSTLYRKLTLPSGYRISVESGGELCVCSQALNYSKGQVGPYGQFVLEQDSNITIKSGGNLYAYGYLSESAENGTGTVTIQNGGTVYEDMMIMDYPGSASTANSLYNTDKIFPMRAYSLRNVEVPMTIQAGGTEYAFASIYGTNAGLHTVNVKIIGNSSNEAFQISSGSMTKAYSNGRHRLTMNGNCALNDMTVSLSMTIQTASTSGLPLPSGFRIEAASGTVNINTNVILLEGTELAVSQGVNVNIANGKSIYVFDETDDAGTVNVKDYHGTAYTLVRSDCKIDVNGTVDVRGALYTTTNKANITSSEGTGQIRFSNSAGTATSVKYKSGSSAASTADLTAAQLHNGSNRPSGEDEYTSTTGAVSGDLFGYSAMLDMWLRNPITLTFDANGGEGTMNPQMISKGTDSFLAANTYTRPGYVFLGWSTNANDETAAYTDGATVNLQADTTLYAIWEKSSVTYTIIWKDYNGTVLGTTNAGENTVPVYDGTPVRPDDAQYTYTFSGWTPEPVAATADATYTAAYSSTVRTYTVTWNNGDGTVLRIDILEYGTMPEYSGETPVKAYDESSHYTFSGWYPAVSAVTGEAVYNPQFAATEHAFTETITTPAGCTTDGEKTFSCACGRTYTEVIPMTGHDLVHHEAKAPTCTEPGWNAYDTCSRCDYTTYQEFSAAGHTAGSPLQENEKSPTCTQKGSYEEAVYCTVCGTELSRITVETDAIGHNWSEWTPTTEPTCMEMGVDSRSCARCGETETRESAALGHDLVHHDAKAPTCTEPGWNAYDTCSRCDYTTYQELAATGHIAGAPVRENENGSSCTENGSYDEVVYCTVCRIELSRKTVVTDVLGHNWGEWTTTTEATCTEKGFETRTCARCGETETRELAALGHYLIHHEAKAATCTEAGWNAYDSCIRCDYSTYSELEATGHTSGAPLRENEKAPTCTQKGSYDEVARCTVCGAELSRKTEEIDALGHDWGDWTVTKEPTCTGTGTDTRICARCGETETRETAALGHDLEHFEAKAPTCTEAGWNAYDACSRCDYTTYAEITALGHTAGAPVQENEKAPTCKEKGSYDEVVRCTACGAELSRQTVEIDAIGHDWGDWTVTKEPTCTGTGTDTRICARCAETETRETAALGHDLEHFEARAPTCTETGWDAYDTCLRCGYTTYVEIPALGHTAGAPVRENEKASTCTEKGSYEEVICCTVCGAELSRKTEETDALGHNWGDWTVTKEPTCTGSGTDTRICVRCSVTESRETAALGHDLEHFEAKAPTCTEAGWNAYETCSRCDYSTFAEIPALGHDLTTHEAKAATCTEAGWNAYDTCSRCDYTTYVEIPALGHDLTTHEAKAATCTEPGWNAYETCSRCDYSTFAEIPALGHDLTTHEAKAVTCTEAGWKAYDTCSRCDYTTYTEIPALGHDLTTHEAKAATCTEPGWNAYETCSRCSYTTYAELAALGHDWSEWETTKSPTCTEKGNETRTCARCGETETRETAASGHDLTAHESKMPTCTEPGWNAFETCSRCSYTTYAELAALGHNWSEWETTKSPTCTEKGIETRTCARCSEAETRETAASGHDLTAHESKMPTCIEPGWNAYETCSRCDYTTFKEIAALGHTSGTPVRENEKAPTCTEKGSFDEVVLCTVCGEELSRKTEETDALGHDWSKWKTTKSSTCVEKGIETRTCARCSETETRETAALGHDLIRHEAKTATCTESGWNAYNTCSRCNYTTYKEIEALGHTSGTSVRENEKAPTCTQKGTCDEAVYCTVCGAELSRKTEETDALGHDWSDWTSVSTDTVCTKTRTCARCGEKQALQINIAALKKALVDAGSVEKEQYTEESVAVLEAVVAEAEAALEKTDSQETVDAAAKALDDAVKALEKKPDVNPKVDRTELEKAIAAAEALSEPDYTPDTFAAVTDALAAARAVPEDADQAAVDAATAALLDAIDGLKARPQFLFDDVKDDSKFYFEPVYWAYYADPQITNGMGATHFGPDNACTRGHVVTFLWRATGCPEPESEETPFTDLKKGAFYEKAVAWAVEQGITKGTSDTTFSPDDTCTRGQIVTFLWRFNGEVEPKSTDTGFTDLKKGAFYEKAVAWAVENGITKGMTDTTFEPDGICTRAQVVTFLYRATADK